MIVHSGITRCSRLHLHFSCHGPGIPASTRGSGVFNGRMYLKTKIWMLVVFFNNELVTASRHSQYLELGCVCMYSMCMNYMYVPWRDDQCFSSSRGNTVFSLQWKLCFLARGDLACTDKSLHTWSLIGQNRAVLIGQSCAASVD